MAKTCATEKTARRQAWIENGLLELMLANKIGIYLAGPEEDERRETELFIIGGFVSLILAWHADGFRKSPEQMAHLARKLMFQPILKES